jgi:Leucine-rich repeat (LRR) protein
MIHLNTSHLNLNTIQGVHSQLISLDCSNNNITKLDNLYTNLKELDCSFNKITKIENLPESLLELDIIYNRIKVIENLPQNLIYFEFDGNPISHVDNIPIEWFNGHFSFAWYNFIKKFQRRFRLRFLRNKSARIIQNGCHNWLWKPVCADGSTGIVPRLLIEKYKNIFQ